MRAALLATMVPLVLGGCISASEAPPATPEALGGAPAATVACVTTGVLFETAESVQQGGEDRQEFEVGTGGCLVTLEFQRTQQLGNLEIRVASPEHELMSYSGPAVKVGPVDFIPGVNRQSFEAGTIPPGVYTYTFTADGAAEFTLRVLSE